MNDAPASRPPRTGDTPAPAPGFHRSIVSSPGSAPARCLSANTAAPNGRLDLLRSMSHLTSRDLLIADWLHQHGVLTTQQITTALFTSITTASHRLTKLRSIALIDRFHRPLPGGGFGPWHWVIGPLGTHLAAASNNINPPTPRQLALRHARLATSTYLSHRLGTNGFFIDLYAHAHRSDDTELVRWWSERDTARRYHQRIHPDGHALWRTETSTVGLFLEYDAGTENLTRLIRKLDAYEQLAADGGPTYPVLFWLHSERRERNLHEALTENRHRGVVPVATGVRGRGKPADAVWTLDGHDRLTLADLPFDHGDPDSMYNPNLHDPTLDQEL